ncbi:MAG: hypothetical protein OSA89_04870 [Mariniblastus sp.]|nr:hypothetical protein [Mariniblastus sp.]
MNLRFILLGLMVLPLVGCEEEKQPTKEVTELIASSPDEVAFTYDEIMAMSNDDLKVNLSELYARLRIKRGGKEPSVAGASVGGGSETAPKTEPATDAVPEPEVGENPDSDKPLRYEALPAEVMRQLEFAREN